MKPRAFLYRCPREIDEAVELLADHAGDAQILAGGQSLMAALNMRLSSPEMLIDINRIDGLSGIARREKEVRIGALVRHANVLESELVQKAVPLLAMAIPHVAHVAVRNRGTTCGSIALADPSAEMPAVAVALNAKIRLSRRGGSREVPAREFFRGLYETERNDDEMISEVIFPVAKPAEVFGFSEFCRRSGDFAIVGIAARARRNGHTLSDFDIVVFGSEPAPLLCSSTQGLTIEPGVSDATLSEIANSLAQDMNPMDNNQGRPETKRQQAAVLLRRLLKDMVVRHA